MPYIFLAVAIISEVTATCALKACDGFTRLVPSALVIVGYGVAFYCLTIVLQTIPVGITYALWAGLGIILVALVGMVHYKQTPDIPAIIGMALIISGVVVINIFSKVVSH